ncbi:MAG: efflux RND transporter permease subunit [Hymenobacter sp.]
MILCIAGIFAYIKLGKEKFPDIVIPRIIVATVYPGTSPTDIENLVTRQLEKEIKSVNGVKKINSTSNQDYCIVDVEFNSSVDVQYAKQLIKDAVDKAQHRAAQRPARAAHREGSQHFGAAHHERQPGRQPAR